MCVIIDYQYIMVDNIINIYDYRLSIYIKIDYYDSSYIIIDFFYLSVIPKMPSHSTTKTHLYICMIYDITLKFTIH